MNLLTLLPLILLPLAHGENIHRQEQARGAFLASPEGVYGHYCSHCHGDDQKGNGRLWAMELSPKPSDLTTTNLNEPALVKFITGGSAAAGRSNLCPPWGRTIPGPEMQRLARYLLARDRDTSPAHTALTPEKGDHREPFPAALLLVILVELGLLWRIGFHKSYTPN
ncbi:MAG: cytochrome c [Planctomycetes bacterium]|nr:cytochrome c [Planctomycetota bacterium]